MVKLKKVHGSDNKPLYIGLDTVYVRTNFKKLEQKENEINSEIWEYDEIQYDKDEFIELMFNEQQRQLHNVQNALVEIYETINN